MAAKNIIKILQTRLKKPIKDLYETQNQSNKKYSYTFFRYNKK